MLLLTLTFWHFAFAFGTTVAYAPFVFVSCPLTLLHVRVYSAGVIADGFHLSSELLHIIRCCKGLDGFVAVSDMAPICGCEPGEYDCLGTRVRACNAGIFAFDFGFANNWSGE